MSLFEPSVFHRAAFLALRLAVDTSEPTPETWLERARHAIRQALGPPLKSLHAPIDRWLGELPMSVAVACSIGLFVVALVWVWVLRREFVFRGAPDRHWWRDLRIWATIVLLPYIGVYLWLGR